MSLSAVDAVLADGGARAPMSAVGIAVVDRSGVLASTVYGVANLETGEPVTDEHWWDLASLTKVLVTLPAVLDLVEEGRLALRESLASAWPAAAGSPYGQASLAQLLSYNAGAPPTHQLFRLGPGNRDDLVQAALQVPPDRPAGTDAVYSDIGMLLLGEMVAAVTGQPLDELARRRTWARYGPPPGAAVATERCAWRDRLIVGEVHDENAAALGGVAGHAGAFGTVAMVAEAARAWLVAETLTPATVQAATRCWATGPAGERFGLGFRLTSSNGLGGDLAGPEGFGVSGFVGNRLWIEPTRGYAVAILGNRIHPRRGPRAPFDEWCGRLLDAIALRWSR